MSFEESRELLARLEDLLRFLLPLYQREGKAYLTVAIGCTGGRHRSVTLVEALRRFLDRSRPDARSCGTGTSIVSDGRLRFLFGIHNHQPVGNFDVGLDDAPSAPTTRSSRPSRAVAGLPLTVHCSGGLLACLHERARADLRPARRLAADGRVELLTGGFYEPILAMLPDWDKVGQIQALSAVPRRELRGDARAACGWPSGSGSRSCRACCARPAWSSCWSTTRTSRWPASTPETLGGYYLTEEQGASLARVSRSTSGCATWCPSPSRRRAVRYLGEPARGAAAVTLVDDGEKFGVWPGTDRHVYEEGWLERFFDALRAAPWLARLHLLGAASTRAPAAGRVYLPTAAYTEMGEWALPAAAGRGARGGARAGWPALPDGARLARLLRGGFWRNFLVKYPEIGDAYWKMLRLSARACTRALAARPRRPAAARGARGLWRGQANDAYWHGVFGGCYLPHLRRAVKSRPDRLRAAARRGAGKPLALDWCARDVDGDGRGRGHGAHAARSAVTLRPARGGTLTELAWLGRASSTWPDVLTRRPRDVSRGRSGSGRGGRRRRGADDPRGARGQGSRAHRAAALRPRSGAPRSSTACSPAAGASLDPLEPWDAARVAVGERPLDHEVKTSPTARSSGARARCGARTACRCRCEKSRSSRRTTPGSRARYRLRVGGRGAARRRAGRCSGISRSARATRPGGTTASPAGRRSAAAGALDGRARSRHGRRVARLRGRDRAGAAPAAPRSRGPRSRRCRSPRAGFERIYQGSALLVELAGAAAPRRDVGGVAAPARRRNGRGRAGKRGIPLERRPAGRANVTYSQSTLIESDGREDGWRVRSTCSRRSR